MTSAIEFTCNRVSGSLQKPIMSFFPLALNMTLYMCFSCSITARGNPAETLYYDPAMTLSALNVTVPSLISSTCVVKQWTGEKGDILKSFQPTTLTSSELVSPRNTRANKETWVVSLVYALINDVASASASPFKLSGRCTNSTMNAFTLNFV